MVEILIVSLYGGFSLWSPLWGIVCLFSFMSRSHPQGPRGEFFYFLTVYILFIFWFFNYSNGVSAVHPKRIAFLKVFFLCGGWMGGGQISCLRLFSFVGDSIENSIADSNTDSNDDSKTGSNTDSNKDSNADSNTYSNNPCTQSREPHSCRADAPKPAGPCSCGATQTLNGIPLYAVPEAGQLRGRRTLNRRGRAAAGPHSCGATQTLNDIPLYAVPEAAQLRGRRTLNRRGRAAAGPHSCWTPRGPYFFPRPSVLIFVHPLSRPRSCTAPPV